VHQHYIFVTGCQWISAQTIRLAGRCVPHD